MANINIQEILPSDTFSTVVNKVNSNFDQLLIAGGGLPGLRGEEGLMGPMGNKGNYIFTSYDIVVAGTYNQATLVPGSVPGNPNQYKPVNNVSPNEIGSSIKPLRDFDLYFQEGDDTNGTDGDIWVYRKNLNNWEFTGNNIKGNKGNTGSSAVSEWYRISKLNGPVQNDYLMPVESDPNINTKIILGNYIGTLDDSNTGNVSSSSLSTFILDSSDTNEMNAIVIGDKNITIDKYSTMSILNGTFILTGPDYDNKSIRIDSHNKLYLSANNGLTYTVAANSSDVTLGYTLTDYTHYFYNGHFTINSKDFKYFNIYNESRGGLSIDVSTGLYTAPVRFRALKQGVHPMDDNINNWKPINFKSENVVIGPLSDNNIITNKNTLGVYGSLTVAENNLYFSESINKGEARIEKTLSIGTKKIQNDVNGINPDIKLSIYDITKNVISITNDDFSGTTDNYNLINFNSRYEYTNFIHPTFSYIQKNEGFMQFKGTPNQFRIGLKFKRIGNFPLQNDNYNMLVLSNEYNTSTVGLNIQQGKEDIESIKNNLGLDTEVVIELSDIVYSETNLSTLEVRKRIRLLNDTSNLEILYNNPNNINSDGTITNNDKLRFANNAGILIGKSGSFARDNGLFEFQINYNNYGRNSNRFQFFTGKGDINGSIRKDLFSIQGVNMYGVFNPISTTGHYKNLSTATQILRYNYDPSMTGLPTLNYWDKYGFHIRKSGEYAYGHGNSREMTGLLIENDTNTSGVMHDTQSTVIDSVITTENFSFENLRFPHSRILTTVKLANDESFDKEGQLVFSTAINPSHSTLAGNNELANVMYMLANYDSNVTNNYITRVGIGSLIGYNLNTDTLKRTLGLEANLHIKETGASILIESDSHSSNNTWAPKLILRRSNTFDIDNDSSYNKILFQFYDSNNNGSFSQSEIKACVAKHDSVEYEKCGVLELSNRGLNFDDVLGSYKTRNGLAINTWGNVQIGNSDNVEDYMNTTELPYNTFKYAKSAVLDIIGVYDVFSGALPSGNGTANYKSFNNTLLKARIFKHNMDALYTPPHESVNEFTFFEVNDNLYGDNNYTSKIFYPNQTLNRNNYVLKLENENSAHNETTGGGGLHVVLHQDDDANLAATENHAFMFHTYIGTSSYSTFSQSASGLTRIRNLALNSGDWTLSIDSVHRAATTSTNLGVLVTVANNSSVGLRVRDKTNSTSCDITPSGACTSSDIRLKGNIKSFSVLKNINKFNPVKFKWIGQDGEYNIGFIAQEIREIFPELVNEDDSDDKYLSLMYDRFGVIAIQGIKEQQVIIDKQEDKINKLEERINKLEELINKLK